MKLAIVIQRYGQSINGGAELHARYIAEHLARHADVEVVTTCATDYVTWRNELAPGVGDVNGVPVRRFPVTHERDPRVFGRRSDRVFEETHSLANELDWLEAEGPASPALIEHIRRHVTTRDFWLFFSYRYYHAFYGARAAAPRAILVPTAERDAAIGLAMFQPVFRGVRAVMYNSPEERAMIETVSGNREVPGVVVGIGSEVPGNPRGGRFRGGSGVEGPFAIYLGRIDKNKGCPELFEFFQAYVKDRSSRLSLVLMGRSLLPIPDHPRIRYLGFADDIEKFDAIAAADLLIMPSYLESLSMVALEAWALGRPVLANARCDVLKGQCLRSNGGLFYESYSEFYETLRAMEHNRWLRETLGQNGQRFFNAHYDWSVIESKYLDMFAKLNAGTPTSQMEPLPGWIDRRRQNLPPADEVLAKLPTPLAGRTSEEASGLTQIHQVLATLGYGDAIGHEVLAIQRVLRAAGHDSEIFVETADPRLESLTRDYRELVDFSRPDNLLVHHFSLGSKASRTAYALPDRMALVYHNITPPEYFVGVHRTLARQCFRGRRELQAYADRTDLALGDSEFNRLDLVQLGFTRTGILPVVPDFSHLAAEPSWLIAGDFDDGWTNVLFVGRVIANKRIEDLIRFFHAYQTRFNLRSRLLIVGAHSGFERYLAALNHLVSELGTEEVHFLGHVSDEELVAFYEVADLFLCASEHEGFCVPLVEAFHKQVPVLAFAATAVPATLDGAGVLYYDKDPMHVAMLMDAILSNAPLQEAIVEEQFAAVDRLLSRDFGGTLLGFIDRILGQPRAAPPHVTYDFWHQFDRTQELEELRLYRPAIFKAIEEGREEEREEG